MTLTSWEGWLIKDIRPICLVYGTHHYITGAVKKTTTWGLYYSDTQHVCPDGCLTGLSPSFPMSQACCGCAENVSIWPYFKSTASHHSKKGLNTYPALIVHADVPRLKNNFDRLKLLSPHDGQLRATKCHQPVAGVWGLHCLPHRHRPPHGSCNESFDMQSHVHKRECASATMSS